MGNNTTEFLDSALLDDAGMITKEVLESFKAYCGLFSLVFGIYNTDMPDDKKNTLLKAIVNSTLEFMEKRYRINLDLYLAQAAKDAEKGALFETFSVIPARMQEDYERGIEDARELISIEIDGIVRIIHDFVNR
jgi:hypothetical protein